MVRSWSQKMNQHLQVLIGCGVPWLLNNSPSEVISVHQDYCLRTMQRVSIPLQNEL